MVKQRMQVCYVFFECHTTSLSETADIFSR
jgi:hypothetical protein